MVSRWQPLAAAASLIFMRNPARLCSGYGLYPVLILTATWSRNSRIADGMGLPLNAADPAIGSITIEILTVANGACDV